MAVITFKYFKMVSVGDIELDEEMFKENLKIYLLNKIHFYLDLDSRHIEYKITSRQFIDRMIIDLLNIINNIEFIRIKKTDLFVILDKAQVMLAKCDDIED